MKQAIIGSVVKMLRERQNLSQAALGARTNLTKDTLSRLERGKQSGASPRTRETLAKVLGVPVGVLTGELPLPLDEAPKAENLLDDRRYQLNIRIDGSIRNAFSLVALHYGIPLSRIVDVAPLLFVLAAEKSLDQRRQRLDDLTEALAKADSIGNNFPHLAESVAPGYFANESLVAERRSIDAGDILAKRIDDSDHLFLGEGRLKGDYDPELDNPFVSSLRDAAADRIKAKIDAFSRDEVAFKICGADAVKLAGGDGTLAMSILNGWVLVHEIPRELLAETAIDARVEWLKDKTAAHEAAWAELLAIEL